MRRNNQGFTLAEMLIVVAIIGVLIAIVTTTISNLLEKAREATDLSNIRTVCSELTSIYLFDDNIPSNFYYDKTKNEVRTCIKCQGTKSGWQTSNLQMNGSGVVINNAVCYASDTTKPYLCIYINMASGTIRFNRESVAKNPLYK